MGGTNISTNERRRSTAQPVVVSASSAQSVPPNGAPPALGFEQHASLVLGRLQSALSELLRAAPGPTRTASEVERAFGVDYKLSWQVHRIASAKNPLATGANVPARVSMEKLARAAAKRHVPAEVIAHVLEAFDEFERLTKTEAGDRAEFDAMLAALVPEVREKHETEVKRAAFKAISQMKGVAMEANAGAFLLHPSADGQRVDRVTFSAYLGLRRLRPGAHIGYATLSATTPGSTALTLAGSPPDDLNSILLPEYCSSPVPRFDVSRGGLFTWYAVAGEHVGLRSAIDLVMAEQRPGAMKRYRTADGRNMSGVMNNPDLPMKRQTTDIFLHKDVYPGSEPLFASYDTVPRGLVSGLNEPSREIDRLPFAESIRPIAGGILHAALPYEPRYVDMLVDVCRRVGWNPADFRGYRLDVTYPVYGAQYMIGFVLPEPPAAGSTPASSDAPSA